MSHSAVKLISAQEVKDVTNAESDNKEIWYVEVEILLFFLFLMGRQLLGLNFTQIFLRRCH
jgi:hypothetical protein